MNISAPASVPDLALLALLLAAPPEAAAAIPGSAPPQCFPAGAGPFHTFGSTLADVLSLDEKPEAEPEEDPKQQAVNALITGVVIPAPAPDSLPFALAMPFQSAIKVKASEPGQAPAGWARVSGAGPSTNVMQGKSTSIPLNLAASPRSVDTAAPFAFTVPAQKSSEPQPASRGALEPVLTIVESRATTVPELAPAPELPNLAFAERFTPAPVLQEGGALPSADPLPRSLLTRLTPAMPLTSPTFLTSVVSPTLPTPPAPVILTTSPTTLAAPPTPPGAPTPATPPTLPSSTPFTDTMQPGTGDRPTESANNQTDGGSEPPPGNVIDPDRAPEQRHRKGAQHSSGESLPQPRASTEPPAREEARVDKPTLEPLAPVSVSPKQTPPAESSEPAPAVKPADIPHLEPEPNRPQAALSSHASDAHAISVRLTDAGDARVELKVTEHSGEVRVSVRTADVDLAGSLRENLGDLVHKLEQSGFRADTWHPSQSSSPEANPQTRRADGESLGEDHSGRQQQHSGDGQERKQQDPKRAGWIDEFETSFGPDSERKAPTWLPA